jgi:hypothetical protein
MVEAMADAPWPACLRLQASGANASVSNSREQLQRSARRRFNEYALVI